MYNFNQSNVIMRWLIHVIISWGEKNLKMFNVKFKVWAKKLKSKFKRWSTSFNVIRNSELKWLENVKVLNYQLSKNLNVLVKYNSKKYTKSEKSEKSSESGNPGSKSKSLSPSPTSTPSRRTTGLIQIKLKSKTDPGIWKNPWDLIREIESGYSIRKARVRGCSSRLKPENPATPDWFLVQYEDDSQSGGTQSGDPVLHVILGQCPKWNPKIH